MATEEVAQLIKDADQHMVQALEALRREYSLIRTGRANPAILDRVTIEYYGNQAPIKQVATIAAPEPRLLTSRPGRRPSSRRSLTPSPVPTSG